MRYLALIAVVFPFLLGCKDNINDKDKRNDHWTWWVDANTRKASWIPVKEDGTHVQNGWYTRFYFNGNIYEKGKLVNGEDSDTIFDYDINGHPQEYRMIGKDTEKYGEDYNDTEYFYQNGAIKMYYPSGSVKAIGEVKNHYYGDQWVTYFTNHKYEYVRRLNRDTGWATGYYETGAIKDSIYVEGKMEVCLRHFYPFPVGQLARSIEFKNHNLNGLQKQYYPNGKLKAMATRVNGLFNGKQMRWYEDGHLAEISYKKGGELDGGPNIVYYDSGRIKTIAWMKKGQFDGEGKEFDESGKLVKDFIYDKGVIIRDKFLDSIKQASHK